MDKDLYLDFDAEFNEMKKSPAFVEYCHWMQLKQRILVINDVINDSIVDEIMMPIMTWNDEDVLNELPSDKRQPIKLYINSDGGEMDIAFALISLILSSKTPIYTYVLGKAYSAGALILMAGHRRFGFEFSHILIHDGSIGIMNSASKTRDLLNFQNKQMEKVREFVLTQTKISSDVYDQKYRDEWYMFGSEAIELGILTEVLN